MTTQLLLVSSGRGPAPARRFALDLAEVLADEIRGSGGEILGIERRTASAGIAFRAAAVADRIGSHVLILPARGRRRRWFVGVSLHEIPDASADALDPADVTTTACRSGGPGGQHANRTASAVRAVHRPTGITVRVDDQRCQHQNRRVALRRLAAHLAVAGSTDRAIAARQAWHSHDTLIRGNAIAQWRYHGRPPRLTSG